MQGDSHGIRCLALPMAGDQLLLPSAVVAEIFSVPEIEPIESGPRWLLGSLSWRESKLPVICMEAVVGGERMAVAERSKIVVLRALSAALDPGYYAVLTQGIPRQVLASSATVQSAAAVDGERPFVAAELNVDGEHSFIPDLDAVERALVAAALSWKSPTANKHGANRGS